MRLLRSPERIIAALGVTAFLAAGCVKPGDPGVSIAPLKADIVFGVKEAAPAAAPQVLVSAPVIEEAFEDETFDEKVLEIPDVTPLPRTRLNSTTSACPAAALTAFPEKIADVRVEGMPAEGIYRFKNSANFTNPDGSTTGGSYFDTRAVRRVTQNPNKSYEFTYEVVQPYWARTGSYLVTTFRVNNNPTVIHSVNQPPQTVGVVPVPGAEAVVTPPADEPGIFVDQWEVQTKAGAVESRFRPSRPVKYLPLEEGILKAGQQWESVGIDPASGDVIRHTATVQRKTRVDACGQVVEGWLIEATQFGRFHGEQMDSKYFYNVATQFGSLFIAETVDIDFGPEGHFTYDASIAKTQPDALPDELK